MTRRRPDSGSGFRAWQSSSLAAIHWKSSLDPSFCRPRRRPTRAASVRPLGVPGAPVAGAEGRPKPKSIRGGDRQGVERSGGARGEPKAGRARRRAPPGSPRRGGQNLSRWGVTSGVESTGVGSGGASPARGEPKAGRARRQAPPGSPRRGGQNLSR